MRNAPTKPPLDDAALCGLKQASRILGRHHVTLSRWRARGEFPEPDAVIGGRPYWRYATIRTLGSARGASQPLGVTA
jgi:hypothetical protein